MVTREARRELGESLRELRMLRILTHILATDFSPQLLILIPTDTVTEIQEALSSSVETKL